MSRDAEGLISEASSFHRVAPFYDDLMKGVPYRMWVSYYRLLLATQGVAPTQVLDCCCGTGIVAEMLAELGWQVTGFDISLPMIEQARQKAESQGLGIRYERQDAAELDLDEQFDAAYSFFDSFNYVTDPKRLAAAFRRIALHLRAGASFIFDMNTAFAFEQRLFNQQQLGKQRNLRYRWRGDWNADTRLITVRMKFWVGYEEFEEVHVQRAYETDEIVDMLERAGFEDIRAFHSYTLDRPREDSDRIHFVATLAGPK